jgi:serine/threonine protein kinase
MSSPANQEDDEYAEAMAALDRLVGRELLGRYRLDELISVGGTGAVFRGHQLTLKRDVAVKILHPELTRNERVFKRFQREAQSTARFEHPNIVQVMEAGFTDDGLHFIVMQLLEGVELHQLLGEEFPPARACEITLQIVRGLEHAHQKGVAHRDLKPENVIVTRDHEGHETIKLVDFGLAKLLEGVSDGEKLTSLGMVFGTPAYMSPEQATGLPVDERTDIYTTGLILYGMLAGRPPFLEEDPVALMRAQVKERPPPLPEHLPAELSALVFKMMAKKPEERIQSAGELRTRLEELLPRLPERAQRKGAPAWIRFAIVGVLAAGLAVGLVTTFGGKKDARTVEDSGAAPVPSPAEADPDSTAPAAVVPPTEVVEAATPAPEAKGPDLAAKPQTPPAEEAKPDETSDAAPGDKKKSANKSASKPKNSGTKKKDKPKKKKGFKFGGFRRPGGG